MSKKVKHFKPKKHLCFWPMKDCESCEKINEKYANELDLFCGFAYGLYMQPDPDLKQLKNLQKIMNNVIKYKENLIKWNKKINA